jgi:hypothetical protein
MEWSFLCVVFALWWLVMLDAEFAVLCSNAPASCCVVLFVPLILLLLSSCSYLLRFFGLTQM